MPRGISISGLVASGLTARSQNLARRLHRDGGGPGEPKSSSFTTARAIRA